MKKLTTILSIATLSLMIGCTSFTSTQTSVQNGVTNSITIHSVSLWDANNSLNNYKAVEDATNDSLYVGAYNGTSSASNLLNTVDLALQAYLKSQVP